jgi:hypothetical protein
MSSLPTWVSDLDQHTWSAVKVEHEKRQWISVEDLLPSAPDSGIIAGPGGISQTVLVAVQADNGREWVSTDEYDRWTGEWMSHTKQEGKHVTHWARLPDPPNQENDQ